MRIDNYRVIMKGCLIASFDAILPTVEWGDIRIRKMKLFQKNGKRWISFSSETVEKDGGKKYYPNEILEDPKSMTEFSKEVMKQIDENVNENIEELTKQKVEQKEPQYQPQEIPF